LFLFLFVFSVFSNKLTFVTFVSVYTFVFFFFSATVFILDIVIVPVTVPNVIITLAVRSSLRTIFLRIFFGAGGMLFPVFSILKETITTIATSSIVIKEMPHR
jgi:hypothetical protein